ncbi:MAG TPA: manganese efflux pump MntP family protein [Thermoanaerobaculia bacterium]|nr:manganese efflux pump MntP family protein [Thermoanaerobaculia bacterium]
MVDLLLIACGLAMDCVAVSAATAVSTRSGRLAAALRMASVFGFMQALMASIGWWGGVGMSRILAAWDHWVAFGLLTLIGGRMIRNGIRGDDGDSGDADDAIGWPRLFLLGLATSIDAVAAGVVLPQLEVGFPAAVGTIGGVTFVLSLAAGRLAGRLSGRFSGRLEIVGGVVLIAIGIRTVIAHLSE